MASLVDREPRQNLNIRAVLHQNLVGPEKEWPLALQPGKDRVVRLLEFSPEPFRHFDTVVVRQAGHRQGLLDRGAAPARATINALEAEVAAHHHEPAARRGPVADELEAV